MSGDANRPSPPAATTLTGAAAMPTPQVAKEPVGFSKDEIRASVHRVTVIPGYHDRKEGLFDLFRDMLVKLASACQKQGASELQVAPIMDTVTNLEDMRTELVSVHLGGPAVG